MAQGPSFWSDFKNFAVKGNALDLAVAVVVGNAFTGVVNSLVGDIMTPLLGLLTPGSADIKNLAVTIPAAVGSTPAVVHYGAFISSLINFLIITLSIFLAVRAIMALRARLFRQGKSTPAAQKPAEERLLEEIRDLLRQQAQNRV